MNDFKLDDVYVRKEDCAAHRHEVEEKVNEVNTSHARLETKVNIALGILGVIGTAVVTVAVKLLIGG